MTRLHVLQPEQRAQWMDGLKQSFQYDFYHLPAYHALAEERGEGQAHLFVCREGNHFIAIPLLLRPIGKAPGLARIGEGWWDATCVYGYAGPIASHADLPASVLRNFRSALREALQERHIVAIFSRLHPLIPQRELLAGLGECIPMGPTVSIDLTLPVDVQRALYRKNHKRDINKLRRLGVTCLHDQDRAYLNEFINIYYENMRRVNASDKYFFEHSYFEKLTSTLESQIHLFVCSLETKMICGGLFLLCDGIVQYHLGGTQNDFLELAPMKLLLDAVRLWANERGARVFHLGGGVEAQEDSLLHFKAGFSDRRHEFSTWRWVLLPGVYDQLCQEKAQWNQRNGLRPISSKYFPAYRCPTVPTQDGIE
jgi:hypothetical protein